MFDVLRILKLGKRFERRNNKSRRNVLGFSPYHRRLVCEPREARQLLSASLPGGVITSNATENIQAGSLNSSGKITRQWM